MLWISSGVGVALCVLIVSGKMLPPRAQVQSTTSCLQAGTCPFCGGVSTVWSMKYGMDAAELRWGDGCTWTADVSTKGIACYKQGAQPKSVRSVSLERTAAGWTLHFREVAGTSTPDIATYTMPSASCGETVTFPANPLLCGWTSGITIVPTSTCGQASGGGTGTTGTTSGTTGTSAPSGCDDNIVASCEKAKCCPGFTCQTMDSQTMGKFGLCKPTISSTPSSSKCGDGNKDPGEECDNGSANSKPGQCCTDDCKIVPKLPNGKFSTCRAAVGRCDVPEQCMGTATCPPDAFEPASTTCRASKGSCDPVEKCPGQNNLQAQVLTLGEPQLPFACPPDQNFCGPPRPPASFCSPCSRAADCGPPSPLRCLSGRCRVWPTDFCPGNWFWVYSPGRSSPGPFEDNLIMPICIRARLCTNAGSCYPPPYNPPSGLPKDLRHYTGERVYGTPEGGYPPFVDGLRSSEPKKGDPACPPLIWIGPQAARTQNIQYRAPAGRCEQTPVDPSDLAPNGFFGNEFNLIGRPYYKSSLKPSPPHTMQDLRNDLETWRRTGWPRWTGLPACDAVPAEPPANPPPPPPVEPPPPPPGPNPPPPPPVCAQQNVDCTTYPEAVTPTRRFCCDGLACQEMNLDPITGFPIGRCAPPPPQSCARIYENCTNALAAFDPITRRFCCPGFTCGNFRLVRDVQTGSCFPNPPGGGPGGSGPGGGPGGANGGPVGTGGGPGGQPGGGLPPPLTCGSPVPNLPGQYGLGYICGQRHTTLPNHGCLSATQSCRVINNHCGCVVTR